MSRIKPAGKTSTFSQLGDAPDGHTPAELKNVGSAYGLSIKNKSPFADTGKDFAYDLAEEINRQLVASEEDKSAPTVNDEDRQGRLAYDSDAREEHDPQAA